jgi:hypothetical protein
VKIDKPISMPNLRPRRSAMGAKSGLADPIRERTVINSDIDAMSTPRPRANTDKNGYTIL